MLHHRCLYALLGLAFVLPCTAAQSTCYGTTAKGALSDGVALPAAGPNFSAYTAMGRQLGRTFVHAKVEQIVSRAYAQLQSTAPGKLFVYGETGLANGGAFAPHRSHQNGLSVDFMVPVVNKAGKSVPLPGHALNKFGYGLEFDQQGRFEDLTIDFEAVAEHLYQLHLAAVQAGVDIDLVIFDLPYLDKLFATPRGPAIKKVLRFMKKPPWIRHDEHYHVDFKIACERLP